MQDWFKQNGMTLVIALATVVATFTLYGYRIAAVEAKQAQDERTTAKLTQTVNDNNTALQKQMSDSNTQVLISLAKLEVDVSYIKAYIDRTNH